MESWRCIRDEMVGTERKKSVVIVEERSECKYLGADAADVDGAPDAPAQTIVLHAQARRTQGES